MSDFKVDVEAMSSFVQSLSSFEEAAKEYDVEDWVPNSGMLENPEVWERTNAFQDTWEKARTTCMMRSRLPPVRSVAL